MHNNLTNQDDDIQEFLGRLILGSEKAWREFIQRYHPLITGTIKRHSSNLDIDDISQKVYLKCVKDNYELLRKFKGNSPIAFKKYIMETAKFIIWDERTKYIKSRNSYVDKEDWADTFLSAEPSPEEKYETKEISEIFQNALMKLEPNQREVIYFLLQGLTNREIAQILNSPLNTILSWSRRGKMNLKKILKNESILQ